MALEEAKKAYEEDEVPIGCVIVKDDAVLAMTHNRKVHDNLATSHAEILAIKQASDKLGTWHLDDCDMYISLEPCIMCAGAIINARIKNVYIAADEPFSATDDKTPHDGLDERFKPYTTGEFYSDNYFRLIWEQYILPNTFFGGEWNGEPATFDGDYTTLSVSYTHYYSYAVDKGWQAATSKDKVISLPKSPRNTKIIVWCQLNDNTDRSFTYEVVDWDETVTVDVPAFD